jgi:hypothetical protein
MAEPKIWVSVRISKTLFYESPCGVVGTSKLTGIKEKPKRECKAKRVGTWEAKQVEKIQLL